MTKKIKLILFILVLNINYCFGQIIFGTTRGQIVPTPDPSFLLLKNTYLGNSITYGIAATSESNRWTNIFTSATGGTQHNVGIPGIVMQNGGCGSGFYTNGYVANYVPGVDGYLFFTYGTNDCGYNNGTFTPALFKSALNSAIADAIATKGWPANRIVINSIYWAYSWTVYTGGCGVSVAADDTRATAYATAAQEVATDNGTWFNDFYNKMKVLGLNSSYYAADGLHPNDAGMQVIADILYDYFF